MINILRGNDNRLCKQKSWRTLVKLKTWRFCPEIWYAEMQGYVVWGWSIITLLNRDGHEKYGKHSLFMTQNAMENRPWYACWSGKGLAAGKN